MTAVRAGGQRGAFLVRVREFERSKDRDVFLTAPALRQGTLCVCLYLQSFPSQAPVLAASVALKSAPKSLAMVLVLARASSRRSCNLVKEVLEVRIILRLEPATVEVLGVGVDRFPVEVAVENLLQRAHLVRVRRRHVLEFPRVALQVEELWREVRLRTTASGRR